MDGKFLTGKLSSTIGLDDKPDLDGDFWPNRNFKPHPIWRQADMVGKFLPDREINHCPGREAPPGHPEHPFRANKCTPFLRK